MSQRDARTLVQLIPAHRCNQEIKLTPLRLLACAVIGDALKDLTCHLWHNGYKCSATIVANRQAKARKFFDSPDLDAWAQLTVLSAREWREVARRVTGWTDIDDRKA